MNIYDTLNDITLYIDRHLQDKIDLNKLARMMGVNVYTMQRIFSLLVGDTISLYIKKRRLTNAALALLNGEKMSKVALDYGYSNTTSFSRAFRDFHGIKPREIKKDTKLKLYYRKCFENVGLKETTLSYDVITLEEKTLYGVGIKTDEKKIGKDAPLLWKKIEKECKEDFENINYAMVTYRGKAHEICEGYYILFSSYKKNREKIIIPKSRWVRLTIPSQKAKEIQKISHQFYYQILPSCQFNLKDIPELEYYHDGITEFLIPIY